MKSNMVHQFSLVPKVDIPRSSFKRDHCYKTTLDSGYLVPFYIDEVLPGDTFNVRANIFARLATPIVPIMDNMFMDTFFFFVPLRLLWSNFQRFMGEQENPGDSIDFLTPQVTAPSGGWKTESLSDYFGLPTGVNNLSVHSFYHRAYNLIWNEWFRDENLQDSVEVPKGDGPDNDGIYNVLRRGKRHDYFTSALPWPQKGPGVEIPLGDAVPVVSTGSPIQFSQGNYSNFNLTNFMTKSTDGTTGQQTWTGDIRGYNTPNLTNSNNQPMIFGGTTGLEADLSSSTSITINTLRQAFQIQRLLEGFARSGTRYIEILRQNFSVISPDGRLQRPEYLGGSSSRVYVNPVAQTSSTDNTSPQGTLAAFGTVSDTIHGFTKSFVEHGVIIGLVNVRADLTYQQGINRMFLRRTREDFYWPTLAHLGEQAIYNKEIYAQGNSEDDDVFGYQERYAEYRYKPSLITGRFRSQSVDDEGNKNTLDVWHLAQDFEELPKLNAEFIVDDPPVERIIAVPSEPQFLFDSFIHVNTVRPMPVYSVPGLVDHF